MQEDTREGAKEQTPTPISAHRKKEIRLRTRRLRVEDLRLGKIWARARHGELTLHGEVEDLSPYGAAVAVPSAASSGTLVLAGDRLTDLVIESASGTLYQGPGLVRRISERGAFQVLGVELSARGLNLADLYRKGARYGFAERLQAAEAALRPDQIGSEFKAYVADFRSYLEAMHQFLSAEEAALQSEDEVTRQEAMQQYLAESAPHLVARLNAFSAQLTDLVSGLGEQQHALYRAYARNHIMPLFREAPFIRRAYDKPLGYAGDYEMMNMLYRDHAEGTSLFAKVLNVYATQEGAAQANINRIEHLATTIRRLLDERGGGRVRLASIGCGPTRELFALLAERPDLGPRLDVALIDQEERSIAFCERTLGPLAASTGARIHYIRESVRRLLTARRLSSALGERELIYSAGLFDYLHQSSFSRLLCTLYEALVPGGLLLVGNVARHNPSRFGMEYYLDWFLIHRSAEELRALASPLQPEPARIDVDSEPSGINLFLRITR